MIVAITYDNGLVFQHYGQTRQFKLYEIENNVVKSSKVIDCGQYSHHTLAILLENNNVNVLCCGGLGAHAVETLKEKNIQIFDNNSGDCDKVIDDFLNNKLTFSGGHTHECHH